MAQLPSAFACQAASPSCTTSPVRWTAKSTIVVTPPQAAARVPVSNVSEAAVPPNGSSMWVCTSMPPGMTYFPVASMVESAVTPGGAAGRESAAIVSPSTSTSIGAGPVALTTVPPVMSTLTICVPSAGRSADAPPADRPASVSVRAASPRAHGAVRSPYASGRRSR